MTSIMPEIIITDCSLPVEEKTLVQYRQRGQLIMFQYSRHNSFLKTTFSRWFLILTLLLIGVLWPGWVEAQGPGPRVVMVKPGDTLLGISERYGVTVEALMAANNLSNPDFIYEGQTLLLPSTTSQLTSLPTTAYQMQPGESVFQIARRFDMSLSDLLQLNGMQRLNYFWLLPEIRVLDRSAPSWPLPFRDFRHSPQIIQGQTGIVEIVLDTRETPRGTFNARPIHFFYEQKSQQGYHYRAFLPTPALLTPADYLLSVEAGKSQVESMVPVVAGVYQTQNIVLSAEKSALLTPERLQSELTRLHQVWDKFSPQRLWRHTFRFPLNQGFPRTSPYGTRRSYNGGVVRSFHSGTDWGAPEGVPIVAPARGTVVLAEPLDVRGGAVIIDHGQGVYSSFWHLSRIDVRVGQQLTRAEQIGLVGNTGLSTGAHLHWEVRVNGIAVDPLQWTQVYFPYLPLVEAK
ncbi:MAG: peptidoglycan DD-metalloendopeptidase family protein [Chloroflexi bacterium]|nr:peptidoglycan DD-metalloendopeptidase family protein [Chloroflexota bacterium]